MTGPDNTSSYTYLGIIRDQKFQLTKASTMKEWSPPVMVIGWDSWEFVGEVATSQLGNLARRTLRPLRTETNSTRFYRRWDWPRMRRKGRNVMLETAALIFKKQAELWCRKMLTSSEEFVNTNLKRLSFFSDLD